ncbi:MAG: T9SS C-terminal target domain-containing protein [Bacteroidetes bacterium]|nr:MAG: T9SS C-terminal target domain-containing protein [Bacteroidota bacterium]
MHRLILLSLSFWFVFSPLGAQSLSRSGFPAASEDKASLRRFPCGGITVLDQPFEADTLPQGWTALDLDGLTPRPEIQFITPVGGWQSIADLKGGANRVLASPAWYEGSTAPSDDWLISPQITNLPANVCLSWYAYSQDAAYPEAYEVRISTTTADTAAFLSLPPVTEIAAEDDAFTYRSLSLDAYAGEDIYLAFRHISDDAFILVLDDIRLARVEQQDLAMFTLDPISAPAGTEITLQGAIINRGLITQEFDSAELRVSYQIDGDTVRTHAIPKNVVLLPNDTVQWTHDVAWVPATDGIYGIKVWVESGIGDTAPLNDTLFRWQGIGAFTSVAPEAELDLRVYPNPATQSVWLEPGAALAQVSVRLLDLTGRVVQPVQMWATLTERVSLDLRALVPGLYLLQVQDGKGRQRSLRLRVE